MNLNEVKKHVYVQCAIYILIGLCFLISLFAILITPAHASEIKTSNITGTIKNTTNCGTAEWNNYCYGYGYYSTNWSKSQFGASQGFGVEALAFDLSGITAYASSPSTIEIYNAANTFTNTNYSCFFSGSNQPVNCSISRVNNGRINVNFTTSVGGNPQYLYITIGDNPNGNFEGLNGININKVMLLQTIDNPNSDVISNANQNTDALINNNNENTESINNTIWTVFDNLIQQINDTCKNLFNIDGLYAMGLNEITSISDSNFKVYLNNSTNSGIQTGLIPVVGGTTFHFKMAYSTGISNWNWLVLKVIVYDQWKNELNFYPYNTRYDTNSDVTFTVNNQVSYIRLQLLAAGNVTGGIEFGSPVLSTPTLVSYCKYGSSISNKLDGIQGAIQGGLEENRQELEDIKDVQQDQYDYLSDDSDPTLNNQGIADVLDEVEVSDPLNYLLTLPISLLQKLNTVLSSNTCQRVSFGSLYNTELYLPCIDFANILGSSIWGTIDLIVGVGLLAIILKRFYESISNILTLGKEKEVKDKLDLPTPMEFFAHIIGGGRD